MRYGQGGLECRISASTLCHPERSRYAAESKDLRTDKPVRIPFVRRSFDSLTLAQDDNTVRYFPHSLPIYTFTNARPFGDGFPIKSCRAACPQAAVLAPSLRGLAKIFDF